MGTYVKKIDAVGIYGRFDIHQRFTDGINIIFGKNRAGKTTLLHILSNALNGDFIRFENLRFKEILITLSDKRKLAITSSGDKRKPQVEVRLDNQNIFPEPEISEIEREQYLNEYISYFLKDKIRNFDEMPTSEKQIILNQLSHKQGNETRIKPIVAVAYFPAFRTMIEAWISAETKKENEPRGRAVIGDTSVWKNLATERARNWFGQFTPMVNFPSLIDIEEQLGNEMDRARSNVWRNDQKLLAEAFKQILEVLKGQSASDYKPIGIFDDFHDLFSLLELSPLRSESTIEFKALQKLITEFEKSEPTDLTTYKVLTVYQNILQNTLNIQNKSFEGIQRYLSSVNEFLEENKSLTVKPDLEMQYSRRKSIVVQYADKKDSAGLRTLSSGERQIMTLIYAATHMSKEEIVVVDEPEISLHVDWQRKLITKMSEQLGDRQIIACTHSPVIGANHLKQMSELSLQPTKERRIENSEIDTENQF